MRVALYARVSTVRQAEKDLSIPDQIWQLQTYCQQNKHDVIAEYREEGASATDDDRPKFQEMVWDIESGRIDVDAILVLTTSRFFRDAIQAGLYKRRLKKRKVRVIAITQDVGDPSMPTANLLETIFAAIDQHESEMIGFHTARGMKQNARRGFFNGSKPPYGYDVVTTTDDKGNSKGILAINPDEAKVVLRIFDLHVTDGLGAVEIAKALNVNGGSRRRGKPWNRSEVLRVLDNPVCIGKYIFNQYDSKNKIRRPESEWIEIPVEPIIEKSIFDAAAVLRKERTPDKKAGRAQTSDLILAGVFKCGKCGASMVSATGKGGRYRYYCCSKSMKEGVDACSGHRVQIDDFEKEAVKQIVDWAFSLDNVRKLLKEVRQALKDKERPIKEIRHQLEEVESKLKRYYDAFEAGRLEPEFCQDRVVPLQEQKRRLELELERRRAPKELPTHLSRMENILKIQEAMRQLFTQNKPTVVKRLLGVLVKEIVINGEDVTLVGQPAGLMALLENGSKMRGSVEVTEVLNSCYKWQPVGDSNPCDKTENLAS